MARKTWTNDTPYNVLGRSLRRLGISMLIGAIYDLALGVSAFLWPSWIAGLMGLAIPQERFYFSLWPVMHLLLACFGILAWMDPKRNIAIVAGAILARLIYALSMFVSLWLFGNHLGWAVVGAVSLALAVAHYAYLRGSDLSFLEVLIRAGNPPGVRRR